MAFFSNLEGTMKNIFSIGKNTLKLILKSNNGELDVKNSNDSSYVSVKGSDFKIPNLSTIVIGSNESVKAQIESVGGVINDSQSPTGFVDRVSSTLSYDVNTRTFTISGTFTYYHKGVKYVKTSVSESVVHSDNIGNFFVYYNGGTLTVNAVDVPWSILNDIPIALIVYNNSSATTFWSGKEGIVLEERHGTIMDKQTHLDLHNNVGTYVVGSGGFAINGTYSTATGTGGLTATSYGVDSGTISDEDIQTTISTLNDNAGVGNIYPVFYRTGSSTEWRWFVNNLPLLKNASNDLLYNQFVTNSWQLTAITTSNIYMNMWLCAVPFLSSSSGNSYRFVWLMGQSTFTTLANAQADNILNMNLAGLPFQEICPLWQITMRYNTSYSVDSGKSRIESIRRIVGTRVTVSLSFNPQSHNNLSDRASANSHPSTAISLDTTNFNNNLNNSITDVQLLADAVDNLSIGGGSTEFPIINTTGGVGGF